ncbi:MAG TPA: Crp/Fnr family transcriptional regulator [Terriglobales bacterium]|jgi:CRP/FNR family transcriptional regulator
MTPPAAGAQQILGATQLFAALDPSELNALAARCRRQSFARGETLFHEGQACRGLYIVITGRVRIFKTSAGGREQVLAVEGPGASVAELPVFDGGAYPASGGALEPTEALFLAGEELRALCLERPEVALKLLRNAGARLRRLVGLIEELSFATVRHRLSALLLRQAVTGRKGPRGVVFPLPGSHQEIASRIGTVRELVSRNLARLQAQGLIEVHDHEVTLLDRDGLEAELSEG